ncbi:MAG: hypothetical protein AAGH15_08260 [Myxococcota bacterium]
MARFALFALPLLLAIACGEDAPATEPDLGTDAPDEGVPDQGAPDEGAPDEGTADPRCEAGTSHVVTFTTSDAVTLEADLQVAAAGGPAAILFHMIPPSNDRRGYPLAFREALRDAGMTVLNVDRRGAGGSGGVATEAYQGFTARIDAAAATDFLASLPCAPDPSRLAFVGASNGTTTVLDHALWTEGRPAASPASIVFMSGGLYTESQNSIPANQAFLGTIPMLYLYPSSESAWNEARAELGVEGWSFDEYAPGAHGTRLFDSDAEAVTARILAHLASL